MTVSLSIVLLIDIWIVSSFGTTMNSGSVNILAYAAWKTHVLISSGLILENVFAGSLGCIKCRFILRPVVDESFTCFTLSPTRETLISIFLSTYSFLIVVLIGTSLITELSSCSHFLWRGDKDMLVLLHYFKHTWQAFQPPSLLPDKEYGR